MKTAQKYIQIACLSLLTIALLSRSTIHAEGKVYKQTGPGGSVTYTSKPKTADAKPAELPEIMREKGKLTPKDLKSCASRGGINCEAGPDADGSVICFDGFTEATARYHFSCKTTKLEVAEISTGGTNGALSVSVRNRKSVAATAPTVHLNLKTGERLELVGPSEIPAFGAAEFILESAAAEKVKGKPEKSAVEVSCLNCQ